MSGRKEASEREALKFMKIMNLISFNAKFQVQWRPPGLPRGRLNLYKASKVALPRRRPNVLPKVRSENTLKFGCPVPSGLEN